MVKYILVKTVLIFSLFGLLGLAACGPDPTPVKGVSTDIVITFQREGGFAGINQEWLIFPDGRVIGPGGQEMQAPPEDVIALLAKSAQIESTSMEKSYAPDDACCDKFIYNIIVKVGDQETRIRTTDGADHPDQVSSLFTGIQGLILAAEPVE